MISPPETFNPSEVRPSTVSLTTPTVCPSRESSAVSAPQWLHPAFCPWSTAGNGLIWIGYSHKGTGRNQAHKTSESSATWHGENSTKVVTFFFLQLNEQTTWINLEACPKQVPSARYQFITDILCVHFKLSLAGRMDYEYWVFLTSTRTLFIGLFLDEKCCCPNRPLASEDYPQENWKKKGEKRHSQGWDRAAAMSILLFMKFSVLFFNVSFLLECFPAGSPYFYQLLASRGRRSCSKICSIWIWRPLCKRL